MDRISGSDRVLRVVVGASLASGAVGLGLQRVVDFTCPFRSVGLACPGCGCTRAALGFLDGDVAGTFSSQPTAGTLLVVLGLSALWVVLATTSSGVVGRSLRCRSIVPLGVVLLAGFTNWLFQLVTVFQ